MGFATAGLEAGLDVKDVAELMGHSSTRTTQDVDQHVSGARKRAPAEEIAKRLGGRPPEAPARAPIMPVVEELSRRPFPGGWISCAASLGLGLAPPGVDDGGMWIAVKPPDEEITLIERGIAYEVGETARIEFEPSGLVCEIELTGLADERGESARGVSHEGLGTPP